MKYFWLTGFLLYSAAIWAAENESTLSRKVEFYFGAGSTIETGYMFSSGRSVGYGDFGARVWQTETQINKIKISFWDFQFTGNASQNTVGNYFPVPANTAVMNTSVAFLVNFCYTDFRPWILYAGLGPDLYQVGDAAGNNSQSYGTIAWQVGVLYQYDEHWSSGFRAEYIKLEQAISGSSSFEEFTNYSVNLGYSPDWLNLNN